MDLEQVENHEYLIKASFDEGLQGMLVFQTIVGFWCLLQCLLQPVVFSFKE